MVAKYRVLIVDDEYLAREDLKTMLKRRHPDFQAVAEAASAEEAWQIVNSVPVCGIFLDIHIQAENERAGLDLAYAINRLPNPPWIVFVTGHPHTAVESYRVHPAHYLLKPLDDGKFDEALDWIRRYHMPVSELQSVGKKRIEIRHRRSNRLDEIEWHWDFIEPEEIVFVAKNNSANNLRVHLRHDVVLDGVNDTLKGWSEKYSGLGLLQIHRSHMVNLNQVRSLKPRPGENEVYKVALKDSVCELAVGPEYLDSLRKKMHAGGL